MEKSVVKENREFWIYYLLTIVTLGIYGLFFMWYVVKDLNTVCGSVEEDGSEESPNFLLVTVFSLLTFGVYGVYWCYKTANRMKYAAGRYGVKINESGHTYLLYLVASYVIGAAAGHALGFITWIPIVGNMVMSLVSSIVGAMAGGLLMYVFIENLNKLCRAYGAGAAPVDAMKITESSPKEDIKTMALPEGKVIGASGMYAGVSIDVKDNEELTIGRDGSMSNLVIEDNGVSRRHCTIRFSTVERAYYVRDYSTNGVFLSDGRRLAKNMDERVAPGSRIRLGQTSQIFLLK